MTDIAKALDVDVSMISRVVSHEKKSERITRYLIENIGVPKELINPEKGETWEK